VDPHLRDTGLALSSQLRLSPLRIFGSEAPGRPQLYGKRLTIAAHEKLAMGPHHLVPYTFLGERREVWAAALGALGYGLSVIFVQNLRKRKAADATYE
jgi:hypothetical protein